VRGKRSARAARWSLSRCWCLRLSLSADGRVGKTTLLKILAGLLRPTAGTVLIDDVPLQAIGLQAYRAQIGCVLQDDRLFAGSIAENIPGFSPSPDPVLIQQVARFWSTVGERFRRCKFVAFCKLITEPWQPYRRVGFGYHRLKGAICQFAEPSPWH
jgi:ABC-type Fe3+/spermidine/putrescine transport system ATPase subunit